VHTVSTSRFQSLIPCRANSRMSERCLPTSHVLCAGDGKERR
jgi:hypothetical protein